jgi:ribosomal protein S18 acetylase RimI-like enzyme
MTFVRAARPDDAPAIGRVHVRSWRAGYRGHLPDHVLDALDPVQRGERWRDIIAGQAPDQLTLVAEGPDPGTVIGFASVGDERTDSGQEPPGEVYAIYVDPAYWGTGAGRALMDTGVGHLTAAGPRPVRLWTLAADIRAHRFYRRYGFVADGATGTHPVGEGVSAPTIRYRLTPPSPTTPPAPSAPPRSAPG